MPRRKRRVEIIREEIITIEERMLHKQKQIENKASILFVGCM